MAKTGYKIDYIVRDASADLKDLLAIHQSVFPGNQLAVWKKDDKIIIKVSNTGQVTGKTLEDCMAEIGLPNPDG